MFPPTLPPDAFLPRHLLDAEERDRRVARRDQLFALCSPAEQALLVKIARWHRRSQPRVLVRPSPFYRAQVAMLDRQLHDTYASLHGKPVPAVPRWLPWLARAERSLNALNARRKLWLRERFLARLWKASGEVPGNTLFGALYVLRAVDPLCELEGRESAIGKSWIRLAQACLEDMQSPAAERLATFQRCADLPDALVPRTTRPDELDRQAWPLLEGLLAQGAPEALQLIDLHWRRTGTGVRLEPQCLFPQAETLCSVARLLRPARPAIAAQLMGEGLLYTAYQLDSQEAGGTLRPVLQQLMAAMAEDLFSMLLAEPPLPLPDQGQSLRRLFRFGDPNATYWAKLPALALALQSRLEPAQEMLGMQLLGLVAAYADPASGLPGAAIERLEALAGQWLADVQKPRMESLHGWLRSLLGCLTERPASNDAWRQSSRRWFRWKTQGDLVLQERNSALPAAPDSPVLTMVDRVLDDFMDRVIREVPGAALRHRVTLVRHIPHEGLNRKQHQRLRDEFAALATADPSAAGAAMERVAGTSVDERDSDLPYQATLCRETLDLLLPTLQALSPAAAAQARRGLDLNQGLGSQCDYFDDLY